MEKTVQAFAVMLLAGILGLVGYNTFEAHRRHQTMSAQLARLATLLDRKETPPQFEYHVGAPHDAVFQSKLAELGKQGWEIVAARRALDGSSANYELILKRQVR